MTTNKSMQTAAQTNTDPQIISATKKVKQASLRVRNVFQSKGWVNRASDQTEKWTAILLRGQNNQQTQPVNSTVKSIQAADVKLATSLVQDTYQQAEALLALGPQYGDAKSVITELEKALISCRKVQNAIDTYIAENESSDISPLRVEFKQNVDDLRDTTNALTKILWQRSDDINSNAAS